jgi:hypothetical protein
LLNYFYIKRQQKMPIKDSTKELKLNQYIKDGKPRTVTHDKKKAYLSKPKISELQNKQKEHEGGIIPLLTLLPLIFGGLGAAGGVAAGAAKIAESVNNAKHNKNKEEIEKQKLEEMRRAVSPEDKKAGAGLLSDLAGKVEGIPQDVLNWLTSNFKISKEKKGNGLI